MANQIKEFLCSLNFDRGNSLGKSTSGTEAGGNLHDVQAPTACPCASPRMLRFSTCPGKLESFIQTSFGTGSYLTEAVLAFYSTSDDRTYDRLDQKQDDYPGARAEASPKFYITVRPGNSD
jgi:hypothetical protein